jgi:hypothetical protein
MMKMLPGMAQVSEKQLYQLEKELKRYEAMIGSMTPEVGGVGGVCVWAAAAAGCCC